MTLFQLKQNKIIQLHFLDLRQAILKDSNFIKNSLNEDSSIHLQDPINIHFPLIFSRKEFYHNFPLCSLYKTLLLELIHFLELSLLLVYSSINLKENKTKLIILY
jgi:hypothetical protein